MSKKAKELAARYGKKSDIVEIVKEIIEEKKHINTFANSDCAINPIGQRMFGYLLNACYFNAYNDDQRLIEWQKFTGLDSKPEMSYFKRAWLQ